MYILYIGKLRPYISNFGILNNLQQKSNMKNLFR